MARSWAQLRLFKRLAALMPIAAAFFFLTAGAPTPDRCPADGPDSIVVCTVEDEEEPNSCPADETNACPVGPNHDAGQDNGQVANDTVDENQADNETGTNRIENGADDNKTDNRVSEDDSNRNLCRDCRPPPGWPFYSLTDWLVPLLALLAIILAILALLLAAARRRGEGGGDSPLAAIIPIVSPNGADGGDGEHGGRATVHPVPLIGGVDREGPGDHVFTAWDHRVLGFLDARNEEMRRVLATLARMGVAWRRADPGRARAWIERLEPHPFYKAGQVLFDLLEWEDFMLDGRPAAADANEVGKFVASVAEFLGLPSPSPVVVGELPPLEPGFYLYRDVVLGTLAAGVATFPPQPAPSGPGD